VKILSGIRPRIIDLEQISRLQSGSKQVNVAFVLILILSVICSSCNVNPDEKDTLPAGKPAGDQLTSAELVPNHFPLDELLQKCEFAFEGKVEKISYRESQSKEGQNPIIHTFITYSVEKVYAGKADNEKHFTLRIIGGPISDSAVLMVPGFPTFDFGDHDILLVSHNGKTICPIVSEDRGRIRVIDGNVFDEYGYSIGRNPDSIVVLGKRQDFEQTVKHSVGDLELKREYSEYHDGEVLGEAIAKIEDVEPFTYNDFVAYLNLKTKKLKEKKILAESADPEIPFETNISDPKPFKQDMQ